MSRFLPFLAAICVAFATLTQADPAEARLDLVGLAVTPHVQSKELRWRRDPDPELGARVQLFLRSPGSEPLFVPANTAVRFGGRSPEELIAGGEWAWHDTPSARPGEDLTLPAGALTVWTFNGKGSRWGVGAETAVEVALPGASAPISLRLPIAEPRAWISAATFVGDGPDPRPDRMVVHVANRYGAPLRIEGCRLWLPDSSSTFRALLPREPAAGLQVFPASGAIAPGERGCAVAATGRLPLTYCALEVMTSSPSGETSSLWAHLRVKRERFDVSGGWVSSDVAGKSTLTREPFLKTLRRLHIDTAHIGEVRGYTDDPELYARYPLKLFNRLDPVERFDTDAMLPRIHAVEFLGEPQYGGGRPVPPQQVWKALAPYQRTRLPTTVTHSEERVWRHYAGLSDYPHYDAYRVTAPAADAWSRYERWGTTRLRWGAPLETIGDMTRSLRELNRPAPVAYWSQGAHAGWDGYGGRRRTSPTPDELRVQAWHALANRITSLYWFNLSLKSLVKFRDLMDPIGRVGREIRMLDRFWLEGDAYEYRRVVREGRLDWDLSSVAAPEGALLVALDLDYAPDSDEKVFRFGPDRDVDLEFRLPEHLLRPAEVFRVDADGTRDVESRPTETGVRVRDRASRVGIWVASTGAGARERIEARRRELVEFEESLGFDPARSDADFAELEAILRAPR